MTATCAVGQPELEEGFDGIELGLHRAQSSRVESCLLGGIDGFGADRETAGQLMALDPTAVRSALQRKAFRRAAMSFIAGCGPMRILDLGCGLPLPHWWKAARSHSVQRWLVGEVCELAAPGSRVLYVDQDPVVMSHARARLAGNGACAVRHLHADLADVETVLAATEVCEGEPFVLALFDSLHEVEDAHAVVAAYKEAAAPGSLLAVSHRSLDDVQDCRYAAGRGSTGLPFHPRSREEFTALFDGWELLGPGVVPAERWSAARAPGKRRLTRAAGAYGAVARKR
ncbi:SAM-dependent methyltransferase [Kitasatospora sp. NPDC096128]|uniref:SAM-dependent methyltransferase n=1 Tax=Kitasatospora sp. NPDC096128 TaxID=3155547 RepID=UPI00332E9C44